MFIKMFANLLKKHYLVILINVIIIAALYIISLYNYVVFHSLAELATVVVGVSVFLIIWNVRRVIKNSYFIVLGVSYFFVSAIDVIHTFAYKGLNIFPGFDANLPTQLWIAARYLQAASFLAAPFFIKRKINAGYLTIIYFSITAGLAALIFLRIFPACYIEGYGLTAFKKISEYTISAALLAALLLIIKNRSNFDKKVWRLTVASIALTMGAEISFTLYIGVYDFSNLIGHLLKYLAYFLIYRAIIQPSLTNPYEVLLREFKRAQEGLAEQKATLDNFIDLNPYGIMITDKDGRALRVNQALLKIFGRMPPEEYTIFEDQLIKKMHLEAGIEELKKGKTLIVPETWYNPHDQNPKYPNVRVYLKLVLFSIADSKGLIKNFIVMHENITERKRAEETLAKKIDEFQRINKILVGRELRMAELKKQIKKIAS